jgi:hypothetical protein
MNVMTAATADTKRRPLKMTTIPKDKTNTEPATAPRKAHAAKRRAPVAASKAKPARKASPQKKAASAPQPSKTDKVLDLLKRPGGVTLKELMKATGWKSHSVRGFLSGIVGKKMGMPVESSKQPDSDRTYSLPK